MKKLLTFFLAVNTFFVYANNQNKKEIPTSLKPAKSSVAVIELQGNQPPVSNRYAEEAEPSASVVKKEKKQYKPSQKELDRLNRIIEERRALEKKLEAKKAFLESLKN